MAASTQRTSNLTEHGTKFPIEIVAVLKTIIEKCKAERETNQLKIGIQNDIERVCLYTGLPHSYISPLYAIDPNNPKLDLYHKIFIFKCMLQSYSTKRSPSFSDVNLALKLDGKKMDLNNLIIEMMLLGYESKNIHGCSILMENPEITFNRFHYLQKIKKARESGRTIYYVDERVIINNDLTFKKPPVDWEVRDDIIIDGLIFCYVITKHGYTNGLFYGRLTKEDLMKWFMQIVLPDLKKESIVVFDNNFFSSISDKANISRYHSKDDMLKWLKKQNIPCNASMHKAELYELIDKCSEKTLSHKLECILVAHGHQVLHLPSSLQELSPTELLWKDMRLALRNPNFSSVFTMKEEINRRLGAISPLEKWSKFDNVIKNAENEIFELDKNTEKALDEFMLWLKLKIKSEI